MNELIIFMCSPLPWILIFLYTNYRNKNWKRYSKKWNEKNRMNWTRKTWKDYESKEKDEKRYFDSEDKKELLLRSIGKCECCGSMQILQFDHITPWCIGGKTNVSNGQVLCSDCNKLKSSSILTLEQLRILKSELIPSRY